MPINPSRLYGLKNSLLELTLNLQTCQDCIRATIVNVSLPSGQSHPGLTRRGDRGGHQGRTWVP